MGAGCGEDCQQVGLGCHVGNGVVDEDGVERFAQRTVRMSPTWWATPGFSRRECSSIGSDRVDGGRVELSGQVGKVVATAGAKVEDATPTRR